MVKVTKKVKTLSTTEQASIKAGSGTCDDACSDGCSVVCSRMGNLDTNTALQWFFVGISNPNPNPYPD